MMAGVDRTIEQTNGDRGGSVGRDRRADVDWSETEREASTDEPAERPLVSVVMVTRNEADSIRDCIESVLRACQDLPRYEVLLVDSNSSDETVQIASEYPIRVLQIPTDDLCTPSAGRFVGTKYSSGDRLLFVDGDMILKTGWVEDALDALDSDEEVAGVNGYLESYINEHETYSEPRETEWLGGMALYEREALDDVGGFNPYHKSYEDLDLGYRLTVAGYQLVRLPTVVATHSGGSSLDPIRRWKNDYYTGVGQVLRWSLSSPRVLLKHARELRYSLLGTAWLLVVGVLAGFGRKRALQALCLAPAGFVTVRAVRTGPSLALYRVVTILLEMVGLARGVLIPPESPETFPLDAVVERKEGKFLSGEGRLERPQRNFSGWKPNDESDE